MAVASGADAAKDVETRRRPIRLLAGGELGLLSVCQAPCEQHLKDLQLIETWGQPAKEGAVKHLTVTSRGGLQDAGSAACLAARASGQVDLHDPVTGAEQGHVELRAGADMPSTACFTSCLWVAEAEPRAFQILTCDQHGSISVHKHAADAQPSWQLARRWETGRSISCAALHMDQRHIILGCKGAQPGMWDLATQQQTFAARAPTATCMDPVESPWTTAIASVPQQDGNCFLAGSVKHHVRLYDTRAHRRPVLHLKFGEARITALQPEINGQRCWVGNGLGKLEVLDFRQQRMAGALKGFAGSVTGLTAHDTHPLLAAVGLDRFLRVYNTHSRELVGRVFLRQQPTCVAFCPTDEVVVPRATPAATAADPREALLCIHKRQRRRH